MIIRENTDPKIEKVKTALGLSGDVYIDAYHHIESLQSHKKLMQAYGCPSPATTIEEAESERADLEALLRQRRDAQPALTLTDALQMLAELGVDTDD